MSSGGFCMKSGRSSSRRDPAGIAQRERTHPMDIPERAAPGDESASSGRAGPPVPTADRPPPSRRRDPRFRAGLLERLPQLGPASGSALEDYRIDEDLGGLVASPSDAVLGPLVPERRD